MNYFNGIEGQGTISSYEILQHVSPRSGIILEVRSGWRAILTSTRKGVLDLGEALLILKLLQAILDVFRATNATREPPGLHIRVHVEHNWIILRKHINCIIKNIREVKCLSNKSDWLLTRLRKPTFK